jgi:hypothetical protein
LRICQLERQGASMACASCDPRWRQRRGPLNPGGSGRAHAGSSRHSPTQGVPSSQGAGQSLTAHARPRHTTDLRSLLKCKELPRARDAFELMVTAILESDVRSGDEILHGGRDQHLTRIGIGLNARCDMDSDSGEIVASYLALTCVHTSSDLEVEALHRLTNGRSAAHRPGGSVERSQGAVAGPSSRAGYIGSGPGTFLSFVRASSACPPTCGETERPFALRLRVTVGGEVRSRTERFLTAAPRAWPQPFGIRFDGQARWERMGTTSLRT